MYNYNKFNIINNLRYKDFDLIIDEKINVLNDLLKNTQKQFELIKDKNGYELSLKKDGYVYITQIFYYDIELYKYVNGLIDGLELNNF